MVEAERVHGDDTGEASEAAAEAAMIAEDLHAVNDQIAEVEAQLTDIAAAHGGGGDSTRSDDYTPFDALSAVASLNRPVVEMGAGTGYWTALLRQKGVDVVAYDAHPPRRITKAFAKGEAKFFGVTYVDDVRECDDDASCLDAHADRVLMLCWPKSPEEPK